MKDSAFSSGINYISQGHALVVAASETLEPQISVKSVPGPPTDPGGIG